MEVKLNSAGIRELLKSPELMAELERVGQKIASAAGEGYEVEVGSKGTTRGRVFVQPATPEAMRDNAENDTLLRALGSGGG